MKPLFSQLGKFSFNRLGWLHEISHRNCMFCQLLCRALAHRHFWKLRVPTWKICRIYCSWRALQIWAILTQWSMKTLPNVKGSQISIMMKLEVCNFLLVCTFVQFFLPLFCFLVIVSLYYREITVYIGRCKVQQNF